MPAHASFLAPSLLPSSIVHLSFPASLSGKGKQPVKPVVKEYGYDLTQEGEVDDEWEEVGLVKRMHVGKGSDRKLVVADSNYLLTVSNLPLPIASSSKSTIDTNGVMVEDMADEETAGLASAETEDVEPMTIMHQYMVKPGRKGDNWVGLEMMNDGVLSTLKSGTLNYHSFSSTSHSGSLPSGINALRLIPSTSSSDPTQFAAAGKDVEVSLWDLEKTLTAPTTGDTAAGVAGGKRKKGNGKEMEIGEVWRARNMPNNNLGVPTPIHHTCLTSLSATSQTGLVTGTLSGHVRRYDTRQRKAVSDWKVAREGGIGIVEQGEEEYELFFADRSSFLGSLDLRTGKILYSYAAQTATPLSILPLHNKTQKPDRVGLVTLSSDATIRLCSTSGVPMEENWNVKKGEILTSVGGVGMGGMTFVGWEERDDEDEAEGEEEGSDIENGGDVWGGMGVIDDDESEEEESDDEDEVPVVKKSRG